MAGLGQKRSKPVTLELSKPNWHKVMEEWQGMQLNIEVSCVWWRSTTSATLTSQKLLEMQDFPEKPKTPVESPASIIWLAEPN